MEWNWQTKNIRKFCKASFNCLGDIAREVTGGDQPPPHKLGLRLVSGIFFLEFVVLDIWVLFDSTIPSSLLSKFKIFSSALVLPTTSS